MRPALFKLIDGNDINGAKALLKTTPSLVYNTLPNGGWTTLHFAANRGRTKFISLLVNEYGMNPNIRSGTERFTPLHQAVDGRSVEAAKALLDLGADINLAFHASGKSYTALELEVGRHMGDGEPDEDSLKILRLLLSRDADYLRDFDGNYFYSSILPLTIRCACYV